MNGEGLNERHKSLQEAIQKARKEKQDERRVRMEAIINAKNKKKASAKEEYEYEFIYEALKSYSPEELLSNFFQAKIKHPTQISISITTRMKMRERGEKIISTRAIDSLPSDLIETLINDLNSALDIISQKDL